MKGKATDSPTSCAEQRIEVRSKTMNNIQRNRPSVNEEGLNKHCEAGGNSRKMVPSGRVELPTCGLGNRRSIHTELRGRHLLVKIIKSSEFSNPREIAVYDAPILVDKKHAHSRDSQKIIRLCVPIDNNTGSSPTYIYPIITSRLHQSNCFASNFTKQKHHWGNHVLRLSISGSSVCICYLVTNTYYPNLPAQYYTLTFRSSPSSPLR